MELEQLTAICPIDGRYGAKTANLRPFFSEYGLIQYRVLVEIRWLQHLCASPNIPEAMRLSTEDNGYLDQIITNFSLADAKQIKNLEATTNHDVKAVEYFIREKLAANTNLQHLQQFIHFACTSEDINNLAYGLMLKDARKTMLVPQCLKITSQLKTMAHQMSHIPMLSRTHGQSATPTTMGKELANYVSRLKQQRQQIELIPIRGKFNGAVGNYNAHVAAYPEVNWLALSQSFVEQLELTWNPYSTQIESHEYIAELCHSLCRFNSILIDLCRDCWGYVSLGYFKQKMVGEEVGSSTMPHKVNPIDFENAEGNLSLANALMSFLSQQLLTSRWQRDLVDSTLMRNVGLAFSYAMVAYQSLLKGLSKLEVNEEAMAADLDQHWELLAEPIQTLMRRYGIADAYEQLKTLTRGQNLDQKSLQQFIDQLSLPLEAKEQLSALTPSNYLGIAKELAERIVE